jgi:hypothetical protein
VRHFVSEDLPAALVTRVAAVFTATDGDIKSLLKAILTADEFKAARGVRFKRPFHYIASALRALGADTHAHRPLIEYLLRMGQGPFQHPTPDGYPDQAAPWLGTLLWRWNLAFTLAAGQVPSVDVAVDRLLKAVGAGSGEGLRPARLLPYFIGRAGTEAELRALDDYLGSSAGVNVNGLSAANSDHQAELLGLILASPGFQRC